MLPLLLVAASVGLSNLAAAIGIGFGGVTARTRIRVAVVFGVFEAGMPSSDSSSVPGWPAASATRPAGSARWC